MSMGTEQPEVEVPFYKLPAVEYSILAVKIGIISAAILANLGVVLTVAFHKCPRKYASIAAASLCMSNIFYSLFILLYATPLRYSESFQLAIGQLRTYCHITQVGSNAPKTWIVAHHVWIAVDTFWLIKKPFQYSTLISKYFKIICAIVWVGLTVFEVVFQSVTLCYYETFYHGVYTAQNPPTCIIPEITNILASVALYLSAFLVVVFLYYHVFKEALRRTRGHTLAQSGGGSSSKRLQRESLTGNTGSESEDEISRKELRLLYGFVALITGTTFFIILRNFYYGACLYIGCQSNRQRNDFLVSTTTSLMISLLILIAPYTYFYRNPLFWNCFLKFVSKICPGLAHRLPRESRPANGYNQTVNETTQHKYTVVSKAPKQPLLSNGDSSCPDIQEEVV